MKLSETGSSKIHQVLFKILFFRLIEQGASAQAPQHDRDHQDAVHGERDPERGERRVRQEIQSQRIHRPQGNRQTRRLI